MIGTRQWIEFWKEIKHLEKFRIDRWLGISDQLRSKLIGFSDSSQMAYGAVVYARTEYPDGTIKCNLVMSKTRVAPLKTVTIPRMELSAAELLSRVIVEVKKSLEFTEMEYILWIDSSPALYWLRKDPSSLKVFIANRVASIQRNTDLKCWKYVNTKDNPADLLSRGVKPSDLAGNKLWLHGPEWLSKPTSEWPAEQFPLSMPVGIDLELRVHTISEFKGGLDIGRQSADREQMDRVPILEYTNNLEHALRIFSFVIRYANALHDKYKPPTRNRRSAKLRIEPPTGKERAWAMRYFIKKAQEEHFKAELSALQRKEKIPDKSKLEPLKPILDENGIIRVGGRLDRANLTYERKHPPVVPRGSRLAWLIMDQAHRRCAHGGVQVTAYYVRQNFWIPRLRDELKNFTKKCVICVRQSQVCAEQLMGELPADRIRPGKAFVATGVDYAGPFQVKYMDKTGQTIILHKSWIAIFVCMKTRAIHIDLVTDLTSASFIAFFEQFLARRGRCERMFSDNGTSFIGAEKEIARAYAKWQADGTVDRIANKGTEWTFMTPAAPHQGGIYEAAVKSMKYHLKRIIGARIMEYQQFVTMLAGIEAILNSRPITPLSDDPDDLQALTPGHFLVSEPLIPPPPFKYVNENDEIGRRLWIERQKMTEHFWKRWENEYLTTLQERKKWRKEKENVRIGQLILLKDENLPPAQWRMGRIIELLPGKDGLVRNILVRTDRTTLKRPIQKICILPVDVPPP